MRRVDVEMDILSALLTDSRAWDRHGPELRPEMFGNWAVGELFKSAQAVAAAGRKVDAYTVAHRAGDDPALQEVLDEAARRAASSATLPSRIELLIDESLKDGLRDAAHRLASLEGTGQEQMSAAQEILAGIGTAGGQAVQSVADSVPDWLSDFDSRSSQQAIGIKTGWPDTDRRLGTMRPGDMIVLAGRPGMGKTALALSITNRVIGSGKPALFFSLEMPTNSLMDRLVAMRSGVGLDRIRTPTLLRPGEDSNARSVAKALGTLPLFIDDQPALTIQEIHARANRAKRMHGISLLVIDFLQLVETDTRHQSRRDHVAEVSRRVKRIAKELKVPVILLSQINRKCEERQDKRPLASDLYEAGAIEQDADAIGFIYRDIVYREHSEWGQTSELIWRKVRQGEAGTDYLLFDGPLQRFLPVDRTTIPARKTEKLSGPFAAPPPGVAFS